MVSQNLIQVIVLHKIRMKDRDNPLAEQTHIQDMALRKIPTVHHLRILMVLLLLPRTPMVLHLISRVVMGMDMLLHSKHLDQ
jgi:predicted MarR family transcription regulator